MSTSMSPFPNNKILDARDVDQILNSLGTIMQWGFNSDKLHNTPKTVKYVKLSLKIIRKPSVDAWERHDIFSLIRLHQSRSSRIVEQQAALESVLSRIVAVTSEKYETVWVQKRALSESRQVFSGVRQTLSKSQGVLPVILCALLAILRALLAILLALAKGRGAVSESHQDTSDGQAISELAQVASKSVQSSKLLRSWEQVESELIACFLVPAEWDLADKQNVSTPKLFPPLPRVRLNPPPIFLRVVGPISTDLRPFHRGEILEGSNVYSLGSAFLENLICDAWTPWDLRSYETLVAAKIMSKGRLHPSAFPSELLLLLKRLVEANLLLPFQFDVEEPQHLAVNAPAESSGLGVSTALTPRAGNDARAAEGALMQQSLSAMINLGVRNLTSRLTHIGERPEFFGGFAEIWRAHLASSNGKVTVAVKYLRLYVTQVTKRLHQEIRIWQRLKHPHVLPLLGICHTVTSESVHASIEHPDPMSSIGVVCPWMENGTLVDFLKFHQTEQENMEELRLRLLIQICSGLMYLHSKNIVHGDLHGGNVLVDSEGCARLADFGLSAVVAECRGTSRTSPGGISSPHGGALRWAAPELFLPGGSEARLHPSADIYSIGGLILQACTGDVPYSYYNDRRVLGAIITGGKPRRPTSDEAHISDVLWSVIEECWQDDPLKRPTAAALESRLQAIYSGLGDEQA